MHTSYIIVHKRWVTYNENVPRQQMDYTMARKGQQNERSDGDIDNLSRPPTQAKPKPKRRADPTRQHYIDKEVFYKEMCEWKKAVNKAKKEGLPIPPVTESIGEKILTIATRVSYMPKFVNYPFREEMISDGVENCLSYIKNFNPKKSNNPFAYFTMVVFNAFIRRIKKEKTHLAKKFKYIEEHLNGTFEEGNIPGDSFGSDYSDENRREFLHNYEESRNKKKKAPRNKKTKLDALLEE